MLEKIGNPDVRVYAVYLPILQTDREGSVPSAMKRLPDKRVSFFWDGKGELAQGYERVLQLPENQPAWDMYLLFNRDGEWKDEPPTPEYWMHQLHLDPARRLDGDKLAAEMKRLLEMK